jgi:deoxyribose-phosphate aldolase
MNIEQDFLTVMSELNHEPASSHPDVSHIISVMDLTVLEKNVDTKTQTLLQSQLDTYPVAAVCAYRNLLEKLHVPASIKKATVVNFPEGLEKPDTVCQTIEAIIATQAVDEIDYVFPQDYSESEDSLALSACKQAYQLCQKNHITFKVILETGKITTANRIYALSQKIIGQGCDFIKTSTGKTPIGATPLAAYAILRAIVDSTQYSHAKHCGLKVSGGIQLPQQAWFYITLAQHCLQKPATKEWFRIGASSLLTALQSIKQ